jgi:hypothetical protein
VTPEPIDWIWPGYLAAGKLTLIDGDPDQGKSLVTLDLAARLTTGRTLPDGQALPGPQSVVLLGGEDAEVDWEKTEQPGPGWVTVPFEFICDAHLDLMVFHGDAFSLPDWIHVSIGDFEEDCYFEGEGNRDLRVSGWLSFSYTKDELEASKLKLPASVEVGPDVDIEMIELLSDEEY